MNFDMALFMQLPCEIFHTNRPFDDRSADDMRCGDLDDNDFIRKAINDFFIYKQKIKFDVFVAREVRDAIYKSWLPKFNRAEDKYNGPGISVHDIYAQEITLASLQRYALSWEGLLYFRGQDHFGLDKTDVTDILYKNFRFFRIWFFLQRHKDYAFKPFFTNFNAYVRVSGGV